MNTIRLHGSLAKHFGAEYRMDVQTVREAFIALCSQLEGFEMKVRKSAFRVTRRRAKDKTFIDERTLDLRGEDCVFDIYPAMVGGKSGFGKVLIGIAIIGLAIVAAPAAIAAIGAGGLSFGAAMGAGIGFMGITYGGIAAFGAMLAFGGLAMMFAPSPRAQKGGSGSSGPGDESSFILSGPINTMYQGSSVPLIYGTFITGSIVISSELTITQLIAGAATSTDGGTTGTGGGTTGGYESGGSNTGSGYPSYPAVTPGQGGGVILGGGLSLADRALVNIP